MLSIFSDELHTLQSDIDRISAELEAKRAELQRTLEAQMTVSVIVDQVKDVVGQMPQTAIKRLKTILNSIIDDSTDDNDNNDNNDDTPATESRQPDDIDETPEPLAAMRRGDFMVEVAKAIDNDEPDQQTAPPEPITEVEQAPEADKDDQQAIDTTPETSETSKKPFTELKMLTSDVGYLVNANNEILAGYAGFAAKRKAEAKGKELSELLRMGYEIRDAKNPKKRLPHKYELRILDISMNQLRKLAKELNPSEITIEPEPKPAPQPEPQAESEYFDSSVDNEFMIGDSVIVASDRHGAEYLDQIGIVTSASVHGAVVEIDGQKRYYFSDELKPIVDSIQMPEEKLEPKLDAGVGLLFVIPSCYAVTLNGTKIGQVRIPLAETDCYWVNEKQLTLSRFIDGDRVHYATKEQAANALAALIRESGKLETPASDPFGGFLAS